MEATIDDAEVRRVLGELASRGSDLSEPMDTIAGYLEDETRTRFLVYQTSPDGVPWKPSRRALRTAGGKTLVDTEVLLDSLTSTSSADEAVVGVASPYAFIHQVGGNAGRGGKSPIPARPYLGVSAEDERQIYAIIEDYIADVPGVTR
jgi:phage virion morphogenesis protein